MKTFPTASGDAIILYEDKDVIAFVKPAGLLSQSAEGSEEKSVLDFLDIYFDGSASAFPVHRLDRGTGGVMIAAKNKAAAAALSALASGDGMTKIYLAAVHGTTPDGGILEDKLFFDRKRNKSFVVPKNKDRRGVKTAKLEYETLSRTESASLARVSLMTGRTHQIRVQMANAGHPLLGDGKYGGRDNKCDCPLWSHMITFDPSQLKKGYFKGKEFTASLEKSPDLLTSHPSGYPWDTFDLK